MRKKKILILFLHKVIPFDDNKKCSITTIWVLIIKWYDESNMNCSLTIRIDVPVDITDFNVTKVYGGPDGIESVYMVTKGWQTRPSSIWQQIQPVPLPHCWMKIYTTWWKYPMPFLFSPWLPNTLIKMFSFFRYYRLKNDESFNITYNTKGEDRVPFQMILVISFIIPTSIIQVFACCIGYNDILKIKCGMLFTRCMILLHILSFL
jgi:hypothetical protein